MAKRTVKQIRKPRIKPATKEVKELCARIDEIRQQKELSIRKFADSCDISLSQAVEIGGKGIDLRYSTIVKIAKGLEITVAELLNF